MGEWGHLIITASVERAAFLAFPFLFLYSGMRLSLKLSFPFRNILVGWIFSLFALTRESFRVFFFLSDFLLVRLRGGLVEKS